MIALLHIESYTQASARLSWRSTCATYAHGTNNFSQGVNRHLPRYIELSRSVPVAPRRVTTSAIAWSCTALAQCMFWCAAPRRCECPAPTAPLPTTGRRWLFFYCFCMVSLDQIVNNHVSHRSACAKHMLGEHQCGHCKAYVDMWDVSIRLTTVHPLGSHAHSRPSPLSVSSSYTSNVFPTES